MDSKKELYQIEFTEDCRDEIREIYKYISENLQAEEAAKRLMKKIRDSVYELAESPRMFVEIPNNKKRKLSFRRMVVDNYVILYTINESKKVIYISHMFYGRRNYLDGGLL